MRFVRVLLNSGPAWGVIQANQVQLVEGCIFDRSHRRTDRLVSLDTAQLLAPVTPSKILAVGRNYAAHAEEMGLPLSREPSVFMEPPSSLLGPGGTVVLPDQQMSVEVEHEAELAVVIGRRLHRADREEAAQGIFGLSCANDVSARDLQRTDTHITRARGFDTFCPLGPWIETALESTRDLEVRCTVNGELRQHGNTSDLLFDVPTLLSHISAWATLLPGDVVLTGTPEGTGSLQHGDRVEIDIEGIGILGPSERHVDRVCALDPNLGCTALPCRHRARRHVGLDVHGTCLLPRAAQT